MYEAKVVIRSLMLLICDNSNNFTKPRRIHKIDIEQTKAQTWYFKLKSCEFITLNTKKNATNTHPKRVELVYEELNP